MDYRRDNGTEARTSKITGIAVTVAVHAALVAAAAFSGFMGARVEMACL